HQRVHRRRSPDDDDVHGWTGRQRRPDHEDHLHAPEVAAPMTRLAALTLACLAIASPAMAQAAPASPRPIRLAVAGLVHGHVQRFIKLAASRADVQLVGISDPDQALREQTADKTGVSHSLLFADL